MDWNRERILERAAEMRTAANTMKAQAEICLKHAILLEEIARAWPEPRTAHWIRWGQYLKCSACGHMVDEKADECPECKAEMERVK